MIYENQISKNFLIGDLYHWELEPSGYFVVRENSSKNGFYSSPNNKFEEINIKEIMEDIQD